MMNQFQNEKKKFTSHKKLIAVIALIAALVVPFAGYVTSASKIISVDAATNAVVSKSTSRIGSRYVYGACHSYAQIRNRNQRAFDCSGLVNWSYYQAGASIGINTSSSLSSKGSYVSYNNLRAGDIVLFSGHAGIYIGDGKMVHAPNSRSRVKVTSLAGYWRSRFRGGRRVITASSLKAQADRVAKKAESRTVATKESVTNTTYAAGSYKLHLTMTVRSGPSVSHSVVGALPAGTTVKASSIQNGKWGKISYHGKTAYVSLKYASRV
ncbi:NlpC/P60 family protein [Intestinibaculum porci]|uniref:NlpC/P60 family protein n=1 Tax=Intestinibaculum porci TaxID=2487118 RepID=UPI0024094267|nr:NlpC/P60 family protein [Intestinibaculum porci]MDD6349168.1 NlpC/P60 family protein [Intestinibaculum porci]MDD6422161.1 NlpC/P60 family protein [Intestinibaculum porci]